MCPDYRERGTALCKHIMAVRLLLACQRAPQQPPVPIPFPRVDHLDPDAPIPYWPTDLPLPSPRPAA